MTAGLPGTGIGGLYYILLVLWMPVRETFLALTGRSTPERRRVVARECVLAAGILAALWLEAWALFRIFGVRQSALVASSGADAAEAARAAKATAYATFVSLAVVIFAMSVLRLFAQRGPRPSGRCLARRSGRAPAELPSGALRAATGA